MAAEWHRHRRGWNLKRLASDTHRATACRRIFCEHTECLIQINRIPDIKESVRNPLGLQQTTVSPNGRGGAITRARRSHAHRQAGLARVAQT